jgi:hypothetical protein
MRAGMDLFVEFGSIFETMGLKKGSGGVLWWQP